MTPIAMFPIMAALSLPMPKEEFKDSVFSISKAGEVVVTATRTPKLLKNTPVQTRVISRRDIERSDATNIRDLLTQTMPGAEFTYAMNQQTHLNFSGFGGQGLLFLVDGERMAGETMDDVDFSRITLENVERIEIVRGAASALYGSNAVGGVVNVITRNNAKSWTAQVNARLAKHGEQRYTAAMGLANKHVSNSLCANFSKTDNYNVHSAPNPVTRIITTIYGDKVLNLNDRFRWQPTEQLTFTARAGYYWRETVRTADVPEHYRSFSGGAKMEWRPTAHDNLSLTYAFDQYDKSDHLRRQNLELRDYSNVQNSVKLLYNHSFSKQHLLTPGCRLSARLFNERQSEKPHPRTGLSGCICPARLGDFARMGSRWWRSLRLFVRPQPLAPHAASESAIPSAAQPNVASGLRHGLSQPNAEGAVLQLRHERHLDC